MRAVEYMHKSEQKFVHMDIKPDNVMRNAHGQIILIDFNSALSALTNQTQVKGTTGRLPPELLKSIEGRTLKPYDPILVDYFCIGLLIYEMVTGSTLDTEGDLYKMM